MIQMNRRKNKDSFIEGVLSAYCQKSDMNLAFCKHHAAAANLDEARAGRAFLAAACGAVHVQMAQDHRRTVHGLALYETAVIPVCNETVEIAVIGQCTVGSAGGGFLIDIIQRREVAYMTGGFHCVAFAVQSESVDADDFIALRQRR